MLKSKRRDGGLLQRAPLPLRRKLLPSSAAVVIAAAVLRCGAWVPQHMSLPRIPARRFFDPEIGNRGLRRLERRPRASFQFVEEGKLQKQAEIGRLRVRPPFPPPASQSCSLGTASTLLCTCHSLLPAAAWHRLSHVCCCIDS
jgi:hypothetical protein